jgi:prepilin-type N-terminal cleavage/methylation domain-containing protein
MWAIHNTRRGFTIVELLIVIVVIAVLASIVIVAYNNVQARASFSKEQGDLKNITKALGLYYVDHESPQYTARLPQMPAANVANDSYLYRSDGVNYQLIRYKASGLPAIETQNNSLLATTQGYNGLAWGYRTNTDGIWW